MWLFAPNITVTHGFSNRYGGCSPAPYDSLNLGGHEDSPENILKNRTTALGELGLSIGKLANLKQVHGCDVMLAQPGAQSGDALVTNEKGLVLAVSIADCYPLLFHDPVNNIIGAAHAGWRGTIAGIAQNTIEEMEKLGAVPSEIRVAIGPGISQKKFEVGEEVLKALIHKGFPGDVVSGRQVDLVKANEFILLRSGIRRENIWAMNRCTFEPEFFSHRRDKGKTGRMWGIICL